MTSTVTASIGRRSWGVVSLGVTFAALGLLLAIAGGGVLAVFGFDGSASTARQRLATPTSALVSGPASITTGGFVDTLGKARITMRAEADGGRPVFVGVGRAADVERYLAGAATDEVTAFDASPFRSSYRVERERHAGDAVPAAPASRSFWIAESTGRDVASLDWKVRDGDYRVVVMNADGSRGVATQSRFGVDVPYAPWVALGVLAGGLVLVASGALLAGRAGRLRR